METEIDFPDTPVAQVSSQSSTSSGDGFAAEVADTQPGSPLSEDAEIARLAGLSPLTYERERAAAAKELSMRTATLDKLVADARRGRTALREQGRALTLASPEPWPQSVDAATLLGEMTAAIQRYVVVEHGAAETVALWVLHAHTLDAFLISPRLAITSPEKNCGKTTLLDVIGRLVPRPLATSNITPAAVFRSIQAACPTLVVDEADTFLHGKDDLRGILNSGHRRSSAFVTRVVGDEYEPSTFSTWAPTAIAMIGRLPATLEDRSLTVRMRRRRHDEAVTRLRADRCPELDVLARKAARWAADYIEALRAADTDVPASLQNRAADNWRPLIAIADAAGGDWPARARQAAEHAAGGAETTQSDAVLLLADIRALFAETKSDRLKSADIVAALASIEGRPWAERSASGPLTRHRLAQLLAPFDIRPQTIRIGPATAKGYLRAQFDDAFDRYLAPTSDQTVTS